MVMIFSNTRIVGLLGTYASPAMVTDVDIAHATVVYTDNEKIKAMAKKHNVEVRDFPKHPPAGMGTTPPQPTKKENDTFDVLVPLTPQPAEGMATFVPAEEPVVKKTRRPRVKKDS